jgi:hypothetical protein
MRSALLGLLGLASFATLAAAQGQPQVTPDTVPAGQANAKAGIAECDRLVSYLETSGRSDSGVTVAQAQAWRERLDAASCQTSLQRLTGEGTQAQGGPAAPTGQAQQPGTQPTVTVRQRQPEVIVRIPPPVITVEQPQPEIIVRMADPEVAVALPQPNVQVQSAQPTVRVERTGEPRIVYRPVDGQPQVRFEGAAAGVAGAAAAQSAQAQIGALTREPGATSALPAATQAITVDDLEDMPVYNGAGEKVGEIDEVLRGADGKAYLLVSHGGFLGLGEKKIALPADSFGYRGDRVVADGLSDEQIKALPEFKESRNFTEMRDTETAELKVLR